MTKEEIFEKHADYLCGGDLGSSFEALLNKEQASHAMQEYAEQEKIIFAIEQLEKYRSKLGGYDMLSGLLKQEIEIQISELKRQLK